mmetsp:Transcript_15004/g.30913  ORF Transcript_15004/g.30913 Transcript_15004/m.30913 type:complete len:302 (-) Transcript_15004:411-1316(-)
MIIVSSLVFPFEKFRSLHYYSVPCFGLIYLCDKQTPTHGNSKPRTSSNMAEQFYNRIVDEVKLASDELTGLLFPESGGAASGGNEGSGAGGSGGGGAAAGEFDFSDIDLDMEDMEDMGGMSEEEIKRMLAEEFMQSNPLQGIADDVTQRIFAGQAQPETPMEHLQAFKSAINWSEKFVVGLVCFQVVMFLLCFYFSRKDRGLAPRVCLLVFIAAVVRSAEWLNAQGEEHWESFATQDYFDKKGIFVGIMLSGPLLLDSLMMLVFFIMEAATLLVQVKRTEIQRKKVGKKKEKHRAKTNKQD